MNYHIMIDDKFVNGFIMDCESVCPPNSNRYFIRGHKNKTVHVNHPKAEWVLDIWSKEFKEILNNTTIKDKIYVHWYDLDIGRLMLTVNKYIPLYVACWGGDFYEDPFPYHINWVYDSITRKYAQNPISLFQQKTLRAKNPIIILNNLWWLLNYKRITQKFFEIKKLTVQRINFLLVDGNNFHECDLVKSIYNAKLIKPLPFNYNANFDLANSIKNKKNDKKTIKIQIGNSATEANNHVDCLEVLKKYCKENVELVLPLSYGNMDYKKFVKKQFEKIFANKNEFLEKFMTRDAYVNKLNEIDIAIMFHNRSQAFGNCITLLTLGVKLYIKSNNPLWNLFNKVGILVFDANTIKNLTFEEFSKPLSESEIKSNIEIISTLFSDEKRLEYLKSTLN